MDFVLKWILGEEHDYLNLLGAAVRTSHDEYCDVRWHPPPDGFSFHSVDGAFSHTQSCMGMGGVVRGSDGIWKFGFYVGALGGDPMLAEIRVMKMGLQLTWNKGIQKLYCESDCLELVKALHRRNCSHHVFATEIQDIHLLLCRR